MYNTHALSLPYKSTIFSLLSGEKWFHRSFHPEQDADQTDSTHLQQDQQVYLWLPEYRGRIRYWQLPRDEPRYPTTFQQFILVHSVGILSLCKARVS